MKQEESQCTPSVGHRAYRLGQISIAAVVVSIILGITVDNIGINSLFTTFALPLSLLTIIVAVSARRGMVHPEDPGSKEASWGLALGVTTLVLTSVFIIGVAVFFTLVFRH